MSDAADGMGIFASPERRVETAVTLAEVPLALAWNVRGDRSRPLFVAAASGVFGMSLPLQPNRSARNADTALLWLGPTSWLFTAGPGAAPHDFDAARNVLSAAGGALFDVSASYVAWSVSGAAASRALNRSCPLDLHSGAFPAGHCAQSLLGHVNALLYRPDERPIFVVMVARSLAVDAWDELSATAHSGSR